jgi:predicted transposase/invertase (TIGR01784 family)
MQVINNHDWPERSLSYLCRCFDSLKHGDGYYLVKEVHHIGFLDYTLFPESPEFYATYRMRNDRTGQLYSGKFSISVVDLKHINLATTDDRTQHRDLWASFFKAKSWEELNMLAKQDSNIEKAVTAVHTLTQDERFRQQCEAREDFLRQQIDHDAWFENKFKEQEATITKQEATITKQETTIAEQASTITELRETVSNQGATIITLQTSIEELRKMVAALQPDNK